MALRTLILTPYAERLGGAEEMLCLALERFDRQRLEPSVVFMEHGPLVEETAGLGIEVDVVPTGRLRSLSSTRRAVLSLADIIRRDRPDVVLNWSAKMQLYGAAAARLAGAGDRVVWWQHQIPGGGWLDRAATCLPAEAVGCSSRAGKAAQAQLRPRRASFVVNPGIDGEQAGAQVDATLRGRLGIPSSRTVVGIVGRLQPWKGQDRFVRALGILRSRGHDVHALIVGGAAFGLSPRYPAELQELIRQERLEDFVTTTGQVDLAAPFFNIMDVAVSASVGEPFGIVLIEAMAAGVAVVAVARGGPLDIIDDGLSGTLARSGEPAALADAIEPLVVDPELRVAMGREARRQAMERFGADRMADELTANLEAVAGSG